MVADIRYLFEHPPDIGVPMRVAEGVYMLRLPLPFALDHVNVWLLEDDAGWTVIDTGLGSADCLVIWQNLLAGFLKHKPVKTLILTHYHPDHVGLSGNLVELTGAAVYMSRTEWLMANMLFHDTNGKLNSDMLHLFHMHGLPADLYNKMSGTKNLFAQRCSSLPAAFRRLKHDDTILICGSNWQCRQGQGHSPEHIALYSQDRKILIAGDHILPKITPNIPMPVHEPCSNPIAEYILSLNTYRDIDNDVLVLPSHRLPFKGVCTRIDQLIRHHHQRLEYLYRACNKPVSVFEILPVLFKRKLDIDQLKFAMLEALSHLVYLQHDGKLTRSPDKGIVKFHR